MSWFNPPTSPNDTLFKTADGIVGIIVKNLGQSLSTNDQL